MQGLVFPAIGQNIASADEVALAKKYQQKFTKSAAALLKAEVVYKFGLDAKTATPYLTEEEDLQVMSLRVNHSVARNKYYDDQSEIIRATLTNERSKKISMSPICGNHEVDQIFYSDAKLCQYRLNFAALGEIQRLSTQKRYQDLKYFTSVYFNDIFPIGVRKITFVVPDWLQIELKEFNFEGYKITKNVTKDAQAATTQYEYTAREVAPLQPESHAQGPSYTYPHLLVLTKGFTRGGQATPLIGSVDDLYGWYASLAQSVNNDPKPLEATLKQLLAGKKTDEEKIKAIYYWVQDNIRYIAFEDGIAGFKPEAAQTVFGNKYGDCKGMANLTKTMLKAAGYDARLVWIGTSRIAYDYSSPSLSVDNHMICCVLLNGRKYFLDATEKFVSFNDNAERIQGRQVLIENGKGYLLDRIPTATQERNQVRTELAFRLEGTKLTGTGRKAYNGEMKTAVFHWLHEAPTDQRATTLKKIVSGGDKNQVIGNLTHSPLFARDSTWRVQYDLEVAHQVSSFEGEVYVDLDADDAFADFTIDTSRVSDVAFHEKMLQTTRVKLTIPAGYKLTHLPKGLEKKHEAFGLSLRYREHNGEVWYEKRVEIPRGLICRKDFAAWNEAVKQLKQAYNDKLILTQK